MNNRFKVSVVLFSILFSILLSGIFISSPVFASEIRSQANTAKLTCNQCTKECAINLNNSWKCNNTSSSKNYQHLQKNSSNCRIDNSNYTHNNLVNKRNKNGGNKNKKKYSKKFNSNSTNSYVGHKNANHNKKKCY
ncbi:hypothetical protein [Peptostreptococcus russellii]|uniref:hypothetical protein n=1 Tax=Peptostreptococcus russellii TaxID=215200 RepID=UPI003F58BBFB